MALKTYVTSLGDVPEAFHAEYEKEANGDGYVLNVDTGAYSQKIGEFRNNNIALTKEKERLIADAAKFSGVDIEKYNTMLQTAQDLEDKKLIDAGQIDELVNQKTEKMRAGYEERFGTLTESEKQATQKAQEYKTALDQRVIGDAITSAALKRGNLNKGALTDVLARAQSGNVVWKPNENGVPTAYKPDGQLAYGKDAKAPLTTEEWVNDLAQSAGHLWQGHSGGGAHGSDVGPGGKKAITQAQFDSGKFI